MPAKSKRQARRPQPEMRLRVPLDRILVYALAFVLFAIPLFIWPGITEYGYGKTMFALIAVSLLSILWGLAAWQRREWHLRVPWITFPFLGFVAVTLLSLLTAINGRVVVQSLVLAVFFFQLALIIANVAREKRDVTLLLTSLVASAFLASLYGLLQHLGVMAGATDLTAGLSNVITTMGNRNYLGGFLGYLLLPSFILVLRPRARALRVAALGLIAFNFGTLMLVEQLAPIVGLIAAGLVIVLGLVIFRPIEPIRRNRGWLIGLLIVLTFTFLIEAPSGPLNSVVGLSQDEAGWVGRIWTQNSGRTRELDWWVGWEMLKARPVIGVGLGNYKLAFLPYKASFLSTPRGSAYVDLKIPRAGQAHNDYVQAVAELGGLGLLAMMAFFAMLAVSIWRRIRRSGNEADRLDLLLITGGLIVFLVHAVVSFPAHLASSAMVVVVFLGLIHAPAYGDACVRGVRMRKRAVAVSLGAVTIFGIVVSAFAVSDLAANALMGAGIQQLQIGDPSGARQILEKSIALDFAPRQTYYYLATAEVQMGEMEDALANYEKCFTRFVDENVYLVFADLAASANRLEEARVAVQFLLSTNPKRSIELKARYIEGMVAMRMRDYSGATRLLEKLASDAPDFELPLIALGNLQQAQGMPALARELYEQALDIVDGKLAAVEAQMAGRTQFTAQEYGELRSSATTLQSERSYILEQLAQLPAG